MAQILGRGPFPAAVPAGPYPPVVAAALVRALGAWLYSVPLAGVVRTARTDTTPAPAAGPAVAIDAAARALTLPECGMALGTRRPEGAS